jgi:hypothetical protein
LVLDIASPAVLTYRQQSLTVLHRTERNFKNVNKKYEKGEVQKRRIESMKERERRKRTG